MISLGMDNTVNSFSQLLLISVVMTEFCFEIGLVSLHIFRIVSIYIYQQTDEKSSVMPVFMESLQNFEKPFCVTILFYCKMK